ncbi:hypothetical protein PK35_11485 [Tamlana nanhaiensis]|uniref:Lipoprotein n=1 Tax=Neotamlana nanhaiensis TaxID=1382798 RepID=A0A0D7W2Z6_9FLAO|nr:hypothetical protein [Tamlana nanhaiensis]KJD32055.1 hypothetical protein PK35_10600 [Tamlana nanhaiensis]KJD32217.1 hypothetical protein PK35_11485 [Tamlana nanhaiensis]
MKANILLLLLAFLSFSCDGQVSEQKKNNSSGLERNKEEIVPKGSWQVNKEFDENGNLKRFDSIYSWSSSGNMKSIDTDSAFNRMQSLMEKHFSMIQSPDINTFTNHDSIFKQFFSNNFSINDFFSNGLKSGIPNIDDKMKQMEALRQHFFNDNYRYIIPPEEDNENTNGEKTIERTQI